MSMSTADRPYSATSKAMPATTAMVRTLKTRCSMAGIMGPSAPAFGVMSEKRMATFAVSAIGLYTAEESNLATPKREFYRLPDTHQ
jgi:hypothetical protein